MPNLTGLSTAGRKRESPSTTSPMRRTKAARNFGPDATLTGASSSPPLSRRHPTLVHLTAEEQEAVRALAATNEASAARLVRVLRNPLARRFAACEWFYGSAHDQDYFVGRDDGFEASLEARGLGHVAAATRTEWGAVRCALGRPRRLSARFFAGEREALARSRATRAAHAALASSMETRGGDPLREATEPIVVGQTVRPRPAATVGESSSSPFGARAPLAQKGDGAVRARRESPGPGHGAGGGLRPGPRARALRAPSPRPRVRPG